MTILVCIAVRLVFISCSIMVSGFLLMFVVCLVLFLEPRSVFVYC